MTRIDIILIFAALKSIKYNTMKTLESLILMSALLMPMSNIHAQQVKLDKTQREIILPKDMNFKKIKLNDNTTFYGPNFVNNAKTANNVSITFNAVSEAGVSTSTFSIYNKDFKLTDYFSGKTEKTINVPEGTYDMFVSFTGKTNYYVYKEDVTIKDGDVIVFDQKEAINDITFTFTDENDEGLFMDIYDGNQLVTKGTAESMSKITSIVHKDYGMTNLLISLGYMPMNYEMEFYINDLSDNYVIANGTNIIANGTTYTYKNGVTTFAPNSVYNLGGENLKECVTTFLPNEFMDSNDPNNYVQGYNFTLMHDGLSIAGERWYMPTGNCPSKVVKNYICCPESDENSDDKVNVVYNPIITNYYEQTEDGFLDFKGIVGCGMLGDSKGIKYVNAGGDFDWGGFNVPEGKIDGKYYPGHPDMSYENPDGEITYGNCCPVTSIRSLKYEYYGSIEGWDDFYFTGRYGEYYETETYFSDYNEEYMDDGGIKTTIVNNNVYVDDLVGKNVTEMYYNYNNEDFCAPTVQMLTFKDSNGKITDRLDKNVGSKLFITGGDYTYHLDEETFLGYFTCSDADIEVEYSLFGKDEWKTLAINEIPEKKFMPFFGNFYEAALDDIECESDNQWFDLKITMKDKAGNYQTQVMSPAFKVLSNVENGISEVDSNNSSLTYNAGVVKYHGNANFEVRTLAGATIRSAYGSEISVDNLPAGAYIVVAKTANEGTLTKKIMVK